MQQVSLGYNSKSLVFYFLIAYTFDMLVSLFDTLHMQQVALGYVVKNLLFLILYFYIAYASDMLVSLSDTLHMLHDSLSTVKCSSMLMCG